MLWGRRYYTPPALNERSPLLGTDNNESGPASQSEYELVKCHYPGHILRNKQIMHSYAKYA